MKVQLSCQLYFLFKWFHTFYHKQNILFYQFFTSEIYTLRRKETMLRYGPDLYVWEESSLLCCKFYDRTTLIILIKIRNIFKNLRDRVNGEIYEHKTCLCT
jgi:hypothetical protein